MFCFVLFLFISFHSKTLEVERGFGRIHVAMQGDEPMVTMVTMVTWTKHGERKQQLHRVGDLVDEARRP